MANQMLNYSDHELIVQLGHSSAKGPEMGPPPNVIVARESTGISKSAGNAAIAAIQSMSGCYRLVVEITGAQLRYLLNHSRLQSVYFADKSINESKYLNDLRDLCKLLFEQTPKSQQNYERTISG